MIAGGGVIGCAHGVLPREGARHRRHDRRSKVDSGGGVGQRRRLPGARLERRLAYTRNDALELHLHATLRRRSQEIRRYRLSKTDLRRGRRRRPHGGPETRGRNWKASTGPTAQAMGMRPMGDESTIAQVHPRKLCDASPAAKDLAGASVVEGRATGLREDVRRCYGLGIS